MPAKEAYEALRARVLARMKDAGWTQKQAAQAIGYDTENADWSYVRQILTGQPGKTSRPTLLLILQAMEVREYGVEQTETA